MAMAVVRPLKAAAELTEVPRPPSLSERLGDALSAAKEPDRRVGELTAALTDALAREDYTGAAGIRESLTFAREEAAIANASVTALRGAIAEIERQAEEDSRAAQLQQQQDEALHRLNAACEAEQELLGELEAEVAAVWAGLEACQRTYQNAVALEVRIGQLRTGQHQARVVLGQAEPGQLMNTPNMASALQEYDPLIRAVATWSR